MGAQWKQKGRVAAADAKGRVFTKLAKEIVIAARNGADVGMNPRLGLAVEAAKKASMPKDTLERAIKKGAGLLEENVNYETVIYEGFAPHQVPVIVECLTENKNRTATDIRACCSARASSPRRARCRGTSRTLASSKRRTPQLPTPRPPQSRRGRRTSSPTARAATASTRRARCRRRQPGARRGGLERDVGRPGLAAQESRLGRRGRAR